MKNNYRSNPSYLRAMERLRRMDWAADMWTGQVRPKHNYFLAR